MARAVVEHGEALLAGVRDLRVALEDCSDPHQTEYLAMLAQAEGALTRLLADMTTELSAQRAEAWLRRRLAELDSLS